MNDRMDIEKQLKGFKHQTDPGLRRTVLDRFERTVPPGGRVRWRGMFWARPVPLYLAAAVLLLAVGLSFMAGRQLTLAGSAASCASLASTGRPLTVGHQRAGKLCTRSVPASIPTMVTGC